MQLLAKDGIYLRIAPRAVQQGVLASGNRADLLLNCPVGTYPFESAKLSNCDTPECRNLTEWHDDQPVASGDAVTGTLLNINAIASPGAPHQCDLPVFKVNRPCCC